MAIMRPIENVSALFVPYTVEQLTVGKHGGGINGEEYVGCYVDKIPETDERPYLALPGFFFYADRFMVPTWSQNGRKYVKAKYIRAFLLNKYAADHDGAPWPDNRVYTAIQDEKSREQNSGRYAAERARIKQLERDFPARHGA